MQTVAASYQTSAPGSLMLLGEYGVLHGGVALCAAINKRIYVTLTPRDDAQIIIHSALGKHTCCIENLKAAAPFEFVLTTLASCKLKHGCELIINSEFSHNMGLGSSAAVTVATLLALNQWHNTALDQHSLLKKAIAIIRQVQGKGSGADVAASIYGGIAVYQNEQVREKITTLPPLSVIFTGSKTTTASALNIMQQRYENEAPQLEAFFSQLSSYAEKALPLLKNKNYSALGNLFNQAQSVMSSLGVSTQQIDAALNLLKQQPAIYGAKISGSGLGDCVIGLGSANLNERLAVQLNNQGCQ